MSKIRYFPKRCHGSSEMAFPDHCDYACAVEKHLPRRSSKVWWWIFVCVVLSLIVGLYV